MKMIYIAGRGKSGSTLLGRMLGQVPGVFMAGEVVQFLRSGFNPECICECGDEITHCPLWGPLLPLKLDKNANQFDNCLEGNARGVLRLPRLMRAVARRLPLDPQLEKRITTVYQTLSEYSECPVIVDTSKTPIYAFLLCRIPSLDLRVVHLVRDSRGVAFDWTRQRRSKAHVKCTVYDKRYHPVESALRWNLNLLLYRWYQRQAIPYLRIHYEAMVADPHGTLNAILAFAEHPIGPLDFLKGRSVHLDKGHTIAGNSNRFSSGWIILERDEAWRAQFPRPSRALVTALTFPGLIRYGYIPKRKKT